MDREELNLHVEDQVKDLIPRVLIVDDEAEFRLLVKDALPGFDVVEAENGRQALDVVQEVKLDLVITDIKMPVLDGIKLLATLRAQFPGLKVLAASGYLDADDVCKHPFDGFVETPRIDRLAAGGLRFTDFYASGAVCSPTRCALQSGQNQARIGITDFIPGHWRPFDRVITPRPTMALPLETVPVAEAPGLP